MKRYLILVSLCLMVQDLFAQNQFFQSYADNHLHAYSKRKSAPTHDGGSIVLYDDSWTIFLCKFDSNSVNVWSKKYNFPGNVLIPGDIIELSDNSFKIAGIKYVLPGATDLSLFIMHVDSSGNLLSFVIDSDTSHQYNCTYECVQICGRQNDDAIFISGLSIPGSVLYQSGFLTKVDSSGNIVWYNYFTPEINTTVLSLSGSLMDDGSLIVTGFYIDNVQQQPTYFFAAKYDTLGTLQWSGRLTDSIPMSSMISKAIEINGNYFMSSGDGMDSLHCFSISSNGTFNWQKIYGIYAGNPHLMKTFENKILMGCHNTDVSYSSALLEIDTSGTPLRKINFDLLYPPFLTDLSTLYHTSSGRTISYGIETSTGNWEHFFAPLDTFLFAPCASLNDILPYSISFGSSLSLSGISNPGTMAFTDSTASIIITPFILTGENFCNLLQAPTISSGGDFEIFPVPAFNNINVYIPNHYETSELRIFNAVGQEVFSKVNVRTHEAINIEYLPDGIYFVHFQSEAGISVKRLIVQ